MADSIEHGTMARGQNHGRSKLTIEQVREIRSSTEPRGVLAARFNIHEVHVSRLRSGRSWKGL